MRSFVLKVAVGALVLLPTSCSGGGEQDEQSKSNPADSSYDVAITDDRFDHATLASLIEHFPECMRTDAIIVRAPRADEVSRSAERGVPASATIGVECQSADAPTRTIIGACQRQRGEWIAYDDGTWVRVGTSC